jgi:uncharacterized protein (TIGR02757 family)
MDPISLVLRYESAHDQEVAAWVAAHLAYGRVAPMLRAIQRVLEPLGKSPAAWLRTNSAADVTDGLSDSLGAWVWRFHKAEDIIHWLLAWKQLDEESNHGGLETHLAPATPAEADLVLSRLIQRLRRELPASPGLRFCLPDPAAGAACKRWRMFLRWMVRTGWPDLGLWLTYPKEALVIPLDTHVSRISRLIGLTKRKTQDGRTAMEITAALRALCPEDPLRYDFALAHIGIMGDCTRNPMHDQCSACMLADVCNRR